MRLFFILFWLVSLAFSQENRTVLSTKQSLAADQFVGVDEYKNLYFISARVLYKQSAEKTYQFSDIQLGQMSSVDIINPLRITVFYDQFNTAVILDNRLNEITRINFNQQENFRNVSFARTASDSRLWIFNIDLQQLELFDYQVNKVVNTSPPLAQTALSMTSNFNTCWVYTGTDLKSYNTYGSLLTTSAQTGLEQLHQNEGTPWALQNGQVSFLPKNKTAFKTLFLDENQIKQLYCTNEILYIYNGTNLITYTLNLLKK